MREVEIKINNIYNSSVPAIADSTLKQLVGYITDKGDTLNIVFNKELPARYARKVLLTKLQVNNVTSTVKELSAGHTEDFISQPNGTEYSYDIGSNINATYIETPVHETIDYTLLTSEANVTDIEGNTVYGRKRLSVPVMSDVEYITQKDISDGIYKLYWMDIPIYDSVVTVIVKKGELIYGADKKLYKAVNDSHADPSISVDFLPATQNDFLNSVVSTQTTSITAVVSSLLITRYIKQVCQLKALTTALIYDGYSKALYIADDISYNKELAGIYLNEGNNAAALLMVYKCIASYTNLFGSIKTNQYN